MKKIEKKKENLIYKLKVKIIDFRREMCFRIKNFINKHTKEMCFSKEELNNIKERVETTKNKEKKFNEFSEVAPDILNLIESLKADNLRLKTEKEFCMNGIKELYFADINNDIELKKKLFGKFGLPFVLEN